MVKKIKVTLTKYTENPVLAIEEAACNCYNSKPSKNGKIMDSCYESGHTSVMEFADFTFHIEGVSRSLLAQLTRHRMSSFAVRSQRFCLEDGFKFVIPPSIKKNTEVLQEYEELMTNINAFYYKAVHQHNIPNEDARYCLPNACHTTLEYKTNGRSLINFMNERLCKKAQWEIRQMAMKIRDEVKNVSPEFAKFLTPKCETYKDCPFCTEKKSCGRHPRLQDVYVTRKDVIKTNDNRCVVCGDIIPEGMQVCYGCLRFDAIKGGM